MASKLAHTSHCSTHPNNRHLKQERESGGGMIWIPAPICKRGDHLLELWGRRPLAMLIELFTRPALTRTRITDTMHLPRYILIHCHGLTSTPKQTSLFVPTTPTLKMGNGIIPNFMKRPAQKKWGGRSVKIGYLRICQRSHCHVLEIVN